MDLLIIIKDLNYAQATAAPIDCTGYWSEWSRCSVPCGGGESTRTFYISKQAENGGEECETFAGTTQTQACNESTCTPARQVYDGACESGWEKGTYGCYKNVTNDNKTPSQAKSACEALNATLAEPRNATENEEIRNLITNNSWIGINDRQQEDTWVYDSDGTGIVYDNWNSNEPNNWPNLAVPSDDYPNEHCVELIKNSGKWNDMRCNHQMNYTCFKNPA